MDESSFTYTGPIRDPEIIAVMLGQTWAKNHEFRRRYWLCFQLAWWFGPLLMAVTNCKSAKFGVIKNGRFRWLVVEW